MRTRSGVWTMALAFLCFISTLSHAQADTLAPTNLPTVAAADDFAKELVDGLKKQAAADPASAKDPILIMHVGRELPAQLKWIVAHLEKAHIAYQIDLVEQGEVDAALADARDNAVQATSLLNYGEGPGLAASQKAVRGAWQNAKFLSRRIFGLPNGFTVWTKLRRTSKQKLGEAGTSLMQGGIAGLSLGFSLYLAQTQGATVHIAPAVAALFTWVAVNGYWGRQLADVQSQGATVTETKPGVFKVRKGQAFFLLTAAIRSFITNFLVVGSAFGFDQLLTAKGIETNVENTAVNLVARSWIDQWINSHQATTLPDGSIVIKEGQWSPKKTIAINTLWNVAYGLLKNMHLLNLGSAAKWTYVVMGVTGALKMVYDERYWFKHKWERLAAAFHSAAADQCESLLIRKSALSVK
ncbi:MAG: hypothetical protein HY074_12070 [Deltaproteobacteria bacterium]|nr:hypothetical protein [Deltaproteobacteria bacterium]